MIVCEGTLRAIRKRKNKVVYTKWYTQSDISKVVHKVVYTKSYTQMVYTQSGIHKVVLMAFKKAYLML